MVPKVIIKGTIMIGSILLLTGCGPTPEPTQEKQEEEPVISEQTPIPEKQEDWISLNPDNEGQTATKICQDAGYSWARRARRCDGTTFDFPGSFSNENCLPGASTYQDCFHFLGCSHAEEEPGKGVIWDAIYCTSDLAAQAEGMSEPTPERVRTYVPPGGETLCEAAFSSQLTSGAVFAPIRSLDNRVYDDTGWVNDPNTLVIPHVEPWQPAEVNTLACIREDRVQEITYPEGEAGYRLIWDVRLVQYPDGEVVGAERFEGEAPPDLERWETMKDYFTPPVYGENPQGSFFAWLFPLLNDQTVFCNQTAVFIISLSPDGKTLAIAGSNNLVNFWDVETRQLLRTFTLSPDLVYVDSLAYSPDGAMIALPSEFVFPPQPIRLWDVTSGEVTLNFSSDEPLDPHGMVFSPDGKTLASGGWDGKVYLWDVTTGQVLLTLDGHTDTIGSLAFSPDGNLLASGSYDQTVRIWDKSGQLINTLREHSGIVNSVAFSPDGKMLASGSDDLTVILTDVATGQTLARLNGDDNVTSVVFSPDGKILAFSDVMTIKLWDVATWKLLGILEGHTKSITDLVFLPDSQTLISGSIDTTVKLWNIVSDMK